MNEIYQEYLLNMRNLVSVYLDNYKNKDFDDEYEGEKRNIDLVSCPEFLREGSAVQDFLKPQRIILGLHDQRKRYKFRSIFSPFNRKQESEADYLGMN